MKIHGLVEDDSVETESHNLLEVYQAACKITLATHQTKRYPQRTSVIFCGTFAVALWAKEYLEAAGRQHRFNRLERPANAVDAWRPVFDIPRLECFVRTVGNEVGVDVWSVMQQRLPDNLFSGSTTGPLSTAVTVPADEKFQPGKAYGNHRHHLGRLIKIPTTIEFAGSSLGRLLIDTSPNTIYQVTNIHCWGRFPEICITKPPVELLHSLLQYTERESDLRPFYNVKILLMKDFAVPSDPQSAISSSMDIHAIWSNLDGLIYFIKPFVVADLLQKVKNIDDSRLTRLWEYEKSYHSRLGVGDGMYHYEWSVILAYLTRILQFLHDRLEHYYGRSQALMVPPPHPYQFMNQPIPQNLGHHDHKDESTQHQQGERETSPFLFEKFLKFDSLGQRKVRRRRREWDNLSDV